MENPITQIKTILPELENFEFCPQKIKRIIKKLQKKIISDLNRISALKQPREAEEEILPIPFLVSRPTIEELKKFSPQRVLTCVFAGENWQVEELIWNGSKWKYGVKKVRKIREKERVFLGEDAFIRFVSLMSSTINEALKEIKNEEEITAIAISFGFAHKNEKEKYGIEAKLLYNQMSKYWFVENAARRKLGQALLEKLKESRHSHFKRIYFANDTIAVALDVAATKHPLPIGVVIGNGANVCTENKGKLINLEIGQSKILGEDKIIRKMKELNLIQDGTILENYFSGAYLLPRLLGVLHLLTKKGLVEESVAKSFLEAYKKDNGPRFLSWLITGKINKRKLEQYLGKKLTNKSFAFIKASSQLIMSKAVEIAALMITAVLQIGLKKNNWKGKEIPITGSVFWKAKVSPNGEIFGHAVKRLVNKWCKNNFEFVEADEKRGIASLALS